MRSDSVNSQIQHVKWKWEYSMCLLTRLTRVSVATAFMTTSVFNALFPIEFTINVNFNHTAV